MASVAVLGELGREITGGLAGKVVEVLGQGLKYQYSRAWHTVLTVLATLTEVGGTKSPSSALNLIKTEFLIAVPGLASPGSRHSPGSPDCLVSRPTG